MKWIDRRRRRRTWGFGALRWLAILSLTGLFSVLLTPLGAAADGQISLTPANAVRAVGKQVTLRATLTGAGDGIEVSFMIDGPNSEKSDSATTNAEGVATLTYTGADSGQDRIVASTDSAGWMASDEAVVNWARLELSPTSQTIPTTEGASIHATVHFPLSLRGKEIHYSVDNSAGDTFDDDFSGTASLDGSGNANIIYDRSDAYAGTTDHITAYAELNNNDGQQADEEPSADPIDIHWSDYEVSLEPSTQTVTVDSNAKLTATVRDDDDNEVDGVSVRFLVTGDHNHSYTDTTDGQGEAAVSYSEDDSGTDNVRAYVDLDGDGFYDTGEPFDTATVNWIDISFDLSPSNQDRAVGDEAEFTATVTGDDEVIDDLRIRYSVHGDNTAGGSATTNSNGQATFDYVGSDAGSDTVSAYVDLNTNNHHDSGEPSDTATVDWLAADLALSPSSQTAVVGTHASITASLSNDNIDVSGVTIRYEVDGANDTSGSVATNSSGDATISYLGSAAGSDDVTAYADFDNDGSHDADEPSATATVDWTGTASLVLAPAIQDATINESASVTASVTSGDTSVDGVIVRYVVSGANSHSGAVTTNSSGAASITYTGTNTGTDYVWAFVDLNNDGSLGDGEPATTVTIDWASAGSTPTTPTTPPATAPDAANPAAPKAGCTFFPETQHNMCGDFASYWNAFGGLAIYGFPITETFQEDGFTVQYFERARFESHPGTDDAKFNVLLGLVGNEVTADRSDEAPFQTAADKNSADCTYYAATGHNLCAGFQAYWEKYGGLAVYGYPISEEFQEVNPDTGQTYTVQYFERARYEWHPGEWPERFDVELGRLGSQVFSMKYGTEYH